MFNKFPNHATPLALVILGAIFPIRHQTDLIREAQDAGQLFQQVDAESFESVVPNQRLVRLLKHDIWLLLHGPKRSNEKPWWGQLFQFVSAHTSNWIKVIWADESLLHLTNSDSSFKFSVWIQGVLKYETRLCFFYTDIIMIGVVGKIKTWIYVNVFCSISLYYVLKNYGNAHRSNVKTVL